MNDDKFCDGCGYEMPVVSAFVGEPYAGLIVNGTAKDNFKLCPRCFRLGMIWAAKEAAKSHVLDQPFPEGA